MLRRTVRLRKEYLFRKSLEQQRKAVLEKKRKLKESLETGKAIAPELRKNSRKGFAHLQNGTELEDAATLSRATTHVDDEYAYAGVTDPKVIVTTSRDPSRRLQLFAKEVALILPNAQRVNRGGIVVGELVELCRARDVSDILIVHEHRGNPDGLVVCHLPYGPTAYFSLSEVVLRHDLPDKPHNISEAPPHLVFHDFTSSLGERTSNILRYLFPPPSPSTKRVMAFVNRNDFIHFRHFSYDDEDDNEGDDDVDGRAAETKNGSASGESTKQQPHGNGNASAGEHRKKKKATKALTELGPRMKLRLYRIELGTVDMKDVETEWTLRPFLNKPKAAMSSSSKS